MLIGLHTVCAGMKHNTLTMGFHIIQYSLPYWSSGNSMCAISLQLYVCVTMSFCKRKVFGIDSQSVVGWKEIVACSYVCTTPPPPSPAFPPKSNYKNG